nr:MAG TPA_asm: hypothetical protein [Caudoviricetes sp.]
MITNPLLYQLSYIGENINKKIITHAKIFYNKN